MNIDKPQSNNNQKARKDDRMQPGTANNRTSEGVRTSVTFVKRQPHRLNNQIADAASGISSPTRVQGAVHLSGSKKQEKKKGAISHFARVVTRTNEQEAATAITSRSHQRQVRVPYSAGIRQSERSVASSAAAGGLQHSQYMTTEQANTNIDEDAPTSKAINEITSPQPYQQMSPYHLQQHFLPQNSKKFHYGTSNNTNSINNNNNNYEAADELTSSNFDPAETIGAEMSSGPPDENEMFPGATRSGEQYINATSGQSDSRINRVKRSSGKPDPRAGLGTEARSSRSQRNNWKRTTPNQTDRQQQTTSGAEDSEHLADDRARIAHKQNRLMTDKYDESDEQIPFGMGAAVTMTLAGTGSKHRDSTDKGLNYSEPNNNQVSQSGRTSQLAGQGGSFQPNGPYFIRESQGNEESQTNGGCFQNSGRLRYSQGDKGGRCDQTQNQYCQKQGVDNQIAEGQAQISEISEDNNQTSHSRSMTSNLRDDSRGDRNKSSQLLTGDEQSRHLKICEDGDDDLTLQERIERKHEKLKGKINQFYQRDSSNNPIKISPPSSHMRFKEQAEINRANKQKKSGVVPSQYSRHSGPLLKGLVSENSCQNLTVQQSPDSNKLDVDNIQFHNLNRSSNHEINNVEQPNYPSDIPPSQQQNMIQRQSDASCPGATVTSAGASFNPADDRPIRPSSIQRMFGHPEDHGLGAFHGSKDMSSVQPPSHREKEQTVGLGKNLLLVKKRIDLNEDETGSDAGAAAGFGSRESFLEQKRSKQQSLSKLNTNSNHAGPRLYTQQLIAQGAESSKNLESRTRGQAAVVQRNTLGRTSPSKALAQISRSKGRDSSSSLRPLATTLYTKLLSSQNCESLTAQPRIDRIDMNANQKMKKMNKNLKDKQQNRSPSALSKVGHRSTQGASKQQTATKTVKTHTQIKKMNLDKLLPQTGTKLQGSQAMIVPMNTDRTHQQVSSMLSFGGKNPGGGVDRQRSGVLLKELDLIGKSTYSKQSGRLSGQDAINGASIHNYLLKKASIDISSSQMTASERSKRSQQKGNQNSESSQKVPVPETRQAQLSDQKKVYKKVSSKYNIKRSPKLQEKRAPQASGFSPSNLKFAQHHLRTLEHETTDMEDYGSSHFVVNKIKSPRMTHTDKNKFNKRANPGGTQSRNNNQAPSTISRQANQLFFSEGTNTIQTLQKSRKELQTPSSKATGAVLKTSQVPLATCKEADRHKRERNAMNSALQIPGTAQLIQEINNSAKKSNQKSKPPNNGIKTLPNSSANNNNNTPLQHSKSNQLAGLNSSNQKQSYQNVIGQGHQVLRHSEKSAQETLLRKKHSNNQIKIDTSLHVTPISYATLAQTPVQYMKSQITAPMTCSNKQSSQLSGIAGGSHLPSNPPGTTKNAKGPIVSTQKRPGTQVMTPKGQKQVGRLQRTYKNQQVDQLAACADKDFVDEEVLSLAAQKDDFGAMNTFMKAKTYKDLKEKAEQNLKQQRATEQKKAYNLNVSIKGSGVQQQAANNEQRKRMTVKKDTSPLKIIGGAQHSGNNQDPPNYQQLRQNKLIRGQNKATTESSVHLTRNPPTKSNNLEQQLDDQSQKRSILSAQASRQLNQPQTNSKNQSPVRQMGNRTSHINQDDKCGVQQQLVNLGYPSPPGLAVNFGQLISSSHQSYGQQQMTALTQRVSMPLNERKNLYLSDSQMMLLDQQQNSQQSILKKNRSSKSPIILNFSQRDSQTDRQSLHEQEQQQMIVAGPQTFGQNFSQQFQTIAVAPRNTTKNQQYTIQQNLLSNVTLSAITPGQVPSQRRDRSLTEHLPVKPDIAQSKGKYNFEREAQNSSRNPNRVRFQESLKDLKSHRSLRHANMSVTSGGGQSGGNLSQYRELSNLNQIRDQKKISKSIQQGRHQGRYGSQQSEKAPEEAIDFNDINSKNEGDLGHLEDQLGEKMKDIQEQLSRMNELSVERKNSSSRRRLRSNSFQRPNMLENQIGTLKANSQHSTSLRDIFQQQHQQPLTFQNLASNSSTVKLPLTGHHNRLNSMQYPVTTSQIPESRQRYCRQDSLNLSQEALNQRQSSQEVKDQQMTVGNLQYINPNLNFNSTTKKVMIDLSIQSALPSHLGPQIPADPQQSAQGIRKFRPQMGQTYSSSHQQPYFANIQPLTISTGSGEFELQNPAGHSPQFASQAQNQNITFPNFGEVQHQIVQGRQSAQDYQGGHFTNSIVPAHDPHQYQAFQIKGMSPTTSSPIGIGYQAIAMSATGIGHGSRFKSDQSGRSSNSSPQKPMQGSYGQTGRTQPLSGAEVVQQQLQPRSSRSRKKMMLESSAGQHQLMTPQHALHKAPILPHGSSNKLMIHDLFANPVSSYQPLNTQVYPDDPLDQEKDFIIEGYPNNTGYYSASGDAVQKRAEKQIRKVGHTSKSSLQALKKKHDLQNLAISVASQNMNDNILNSTSKLNYSQASKKPKNLMHQTSHHQQLPTGINQRLFTTASNQEVINQQLDSAYTSDQQQPWPTQKQAQHGLHSQHSARYQLPQSQSETQQLYQQQPSHEPSSGGLGRTSIVNDKLMDQTRGDHSNLQNVQSSDCYLSSACHGSQQSLSDKKNMNMQGATREKQGSDGKMYIFFGK